ncbi:acyl-coenzyme A thioesterase PaaI-like protein [Alicyclobacillus tengchongensis]|uniref:Acyl-coenzyme A thioesterase PaaI-like protein n=3 Tax=Alicyclobacillaceae TaxID=186823 RepID=A0ABT9LW08_9BACL|nr:acyl-coenzyme A thioesterase PaaI-like protein [Alicyclobacillus tengchongensis]SHK17127.1 DeoR-like helix-turn-helix domain-containing protein [Alicyclobacillus montanus]
MYIQKHPFATDEQLAEHFGVSVATIRLDRQKLAIPEARERIRRLAETSHDALRSLDQQEITGELKELRLNEYAVSELTIEAQHVFHRYQIARGHVLFAQVNSLATAMVDADIAVTAKSELRFANPAYLGETVHARVEVVARRKHVLRCFAVAHVEKKIILKGQIWMIAGPVWNA